MVEIAVVRRLSGDLVAAACQAEAGDPDAPAWEAELRAQRLLAGIATITAACAPGAGRRPAEPRSQGPTRRAGSLTASALR